jgi:hypothetical protein
MRRGIGPSHSKHNSSKRFAELESCLNSLSLRKQSFCDQLKDAEEDLKLKPLSSLSKFTLSQDYFEGKHKLHSMQNKRLAELQALGSQLLGIEPQSRGSQLVGRKVLSTMKSRLALKASRRKIKDVRICRSIDLVSLVKEGAKVMAVKKMRRDVDSVVRKQASRLWLNHLSRRRLSKEDEIAQCSPSLERSTAPAISPLSATPTHKLSFRSDCLRSLSPTTSTALSPVSITTTKPKRLMRDRLKLK